MEEKDIQVIPPIQKKDNKYLITLFKGQSQADPERYEKNQLIMFRLGFEIIGKASDYTQLPDEYKQLIDIVKTTDLDIEIIVKFLEKKMDHNQVIKFMSSIVEVYKIAKVGEKIGELEMDATLFKEFTEMLNYLLFKTVNNDAVF